LEEQRRHTHSRGIRGVQSEMSDLFQLTEVRGQRTEQCLECPDPREKIAVPEGIVVRAHRCHTTPTLLCAGPNRPRDVRELEVVKDEAPTS
jgi:hypothetical protein